MSTTEDEMVTITLAEYRGLQYCEASLEFLLALGVDNWQGYQTLPDREDFTSYEKFEEAIEKAFDF